MPSPFIDPTAKHPYVLKADRDKPEADQHRFFFRVMSVRENAAYADILRFEKDAAGTLMATNYLAHRIELLRFTLVGWEGPGAPQFTTDKNGCASDESLSRLHGEIGYELADFANSINVLKDETAGKS